MADISKINGITIADISKINGIAIASWAKIRGYDIPSGANYLLDNLTATAVLALSPYLLRADFTGYCFLVRRTDGEEYEIAFDSNGVISVNSLCYQSDISQGAVSSVFSGTNGYIVNYHDQSTGSNDFVITTESAQPQIIDNGAIITNVDGFKAVNFDGGDVLANSYTSDLDFSGSDEFSICPLGFQASTSVDGDVFGRFGASAAISQYIMKVESDNNSIKFATYSGSAYKVITSSSNTVSPISNIDVCALIDSSNLEIYIDNSLDGTTSRQDIQSIPTSERIAFGKDPDAKIETLLVFGSALDSTDRTTIYNRNN